MPSLPISLGGLFPQLAAVCDPNDDVNRLEEIKTSFNHIHDAVQNSMDLNFTHFEFIKAKLELARSELERNEEEVDHKELLQVVYNDIIAEFKEFSGGFKDAFENVKHCASYVNSEIFPLRAYFYDCKINDFHKGEVNEIIAMHLFREGLFDIGDGFVKEVGNVELRDKMADLRPLFKNLLDIVSAVRNCELELPLVWVSENRERLGETKASELELKIHAIKFLSIVEDSPLGIEAVNYAITHLKPLTLTNKLNLKEVEYLMGCLIHEVNQIRLNPSSPYFDLFDGSYQRNLIAEIERQFYIMMGQCTRDPLKTVASAGAKFLSGVYQAARIVEKKYGCRWTQAGLVPLDVNLDKELKFHSQFMCPAMKVAMANGLNPPVAYGCGHVVSFHYMLAWNSTWPTWTISCPLCNFVTTKGEHKTVYF